MDVVLIQDVKGYGSSGTVISVSPGYARSFLFPRKMAVEASSKDGKIAVMERDVSRKNTTTKKEAVEGALENLPESIVIHAKANEKGVLFQSVGERMIAEALGIDEGVYDIAIDEQIKEIGTHNITIGGKSLTIEVKEE